MEKFHHLLDLCIKHHRVLGLGLLSLLTAGGERILSNVAFECPCSATWNLPYSLIFFLFPALILLPLGYLLSSQAGRLMTGCCSQDENTRRNVSWKTRLGLCCRVMCSNTTLAAAVAPVTWIAVALLGGRFYECAASGSLWAQKRLCQEQGPSCSETLQHIPCQKKNSEQVQELLKEFKAQSQVAGWAVIVFVMAVFMIVKFYSTCTSPVSFLQFKFQKIYKRKKEEILKTKLIEYATQLAERDVRNELTYGHLDSVIIPMKNPREISSVDKTSPTETQGVDYENPVPI